MIFYTKVADMEVDDNVKCLIVNHTDLNIELGMFETIFSFCKSTSAG